MKEIFNRRSIRKFTDQAVESEKIDKILRAAMQAPSAINEQPWEFIVVQDKEQLSKLSLTSPYAKPAADSSVTIVVLGNANELKVAAGLDEDLGAATQNILLESVHLGLGAVWLGVATSDEVKENVRKFFDLPDHIKPYSMIAIGYPDGQENKFVDRYKAERVHNNIW
ncbi:nitroreductase family protein [Lacrimispora sp.]|jgi:nitroreductase|uniref:nitroreductase family protein n=1 Tax=Lacrimispora sp. TaxID=2719234 RepID=UPI0028A6FEC6|nr:nitroreductase family protein [Lacrimispora sp.]